MFNIKRLSAAFYIFSCLLLIGCDQPDETHSADTTEQPHQSTAAFATHADTPSCIQCETSLASHFHIPIEHYYEALLAGVSSFHDGFMQHNTVNTDSFEPMTSTELYQRDLARTAPALQTNVSESELFEALYLTENGIVNANTLDETIVNEYPFYIMHNQVGLRSQEYMAFNLRHEKNALLDLLNEQQATSFSESLHQVIQTLEFDSDAYAYVEIKHLSDTIISLKPFEEANNTHLQALMPLHDEQALPSFLSPSGFYQYTLNNAYPFHSALPVLLTTSVIFMQDGSIQFYQQKTEGCKQTPCELVLSPYMGTWGLDSIYDTPAIVLTFPPQLLKNNQPEMYAFIIKDNRIYLGSIQAAGESIATKFNGSAAAQILSRFQRDTIN